MVNFMMEADSFLFGVSMGCCWSKFLAIFVGSTITFHGNRSVAQITPDATLPNNSNVNLVDKTFNITGGTQAEGNLFHSFKEFSVPTGSTASFQNGVGIQNIINRVTGGSISNIDGLIKANGSANFFLINPAGIVFGQNARLNIGGSFVGSTADSLLFEDGFEFSATNSTSTPLLTVNVPLGLQFGGNPGSIQVKGNGEGRRRTSEIIDTTEALRVDSDKTLALVGGNINLEGATLKTAGGRIELGSVVGEGKVDIAIANKGFSFGYENAGNLGNIELTQQSAVDASGEGAGDIQINGTRVSVSGGSQIDSSTLGANSGGGIFVNAKESLQVIGGSGSGRFGFESALVAFVDEGATGNGGSLTIKAGELIVKDGASLSTSSLGDGKGGNLNITANQVKVIGESADGSFSSNISSQSGEGIGDAGNLNINTSELLIKDAGQISVSTSGTGQGGNLNITADTVKVIGISVDDRPPPSFLLAITLDKGHAGKISIKTRELLIQDGGQILASTFGAGKGGSLDIEADRVQVISRSDNGLIGSSIAVNSNPGATGNAGELKINAKELIIKDGAFVSGGTFGEGRGGNLIINAEKIEIAGESANGFNSKLTSQVNSFRGEEATGDAGSLRINTNTLQIKDEGQISVGTFSNGNGGHLIVRADKIELTNNSSLVARAEPLSSGNGGNLDIRAGKLFVNQSTIGVESLGTGTAGNLTINARSINLENQAILTANTRSARINPDIEQATININSRDLILRRNSNITTNAAVENVIGGNINIDTDILAAFEDSDITANSANFRGGNVIINSTGVFGTKFRDVLTPQSDITATGANPELSGNVEVNAPDNQIEEQPQLPADIRQAEFDQRCSSGGEVAQNSFTIPGRGGLPPSPNHTLNSSIPWEDWRIVEDNNSSVARVSDSESSISKRTSISSNKLEKKQNRIVEATGWIVDKHGNIEFVARANQINPKNFWKTPTCNVSG